MSGRTKGRHDTLQIIKDRDEYSHSIEINNDNAKNETRFSVKVRSDLPIEQVVKKAWETFKALQKGEMPVA